MRKPWINLPRIILKKLTRSLDLRIFMDLKIRLLMLLIVDFTRVAVGFNVPCLYRFLIAAAAVPTIIIAVAVITLIVGTTATPSHVTIASRFVPLPSPK